MHELAVTETTNHVLTAYVKPLGQCLGLDSDDSSNFSPSRSEHPLTWYHSNLRIAYEEEKRDNEINQQGNSICLAAYK